MKLEIDIPDEELKALLKQRVMELANNAIHGLDLTWRISETIKWSWHEEINSMVRQMLANMPEVEAEIRAAMRSKLTAQLDKIMSKEQV